MPSSYEMGQAQSDGRRYVRETHTDAFGDFVACEYLAADGTDYAAVMTARAIAIDEEKKQSEISRNIASISEHGSLAVTLFKYSTKAENISPLREAYRRAGRETCIMIADYLATLTDAQLRNIFGKTQAQVDTLRADKLTPAIDLANKIRNAGGE